MPRVFSLRVAILIVLVVSGVLPYTAPNSKPHLHPSPNPLLSLLRVFSLGSPGLVCASLLSDIPMFSSPGTLDLMKFLSTSGNN